MPSFLRLFTVPMFVTVAMRVSRRAPNVAYPSGPIVGPPSASDREWAFQCDRQCRWEHDFFNRAIIGENANGRLIKNNQRCRCYLSINATAAQRFDGEIRKWTEREFDSANTWSGDFSCRLVCADTADGLETMTKDQAQTSPEVREIMHCGACAACSAPEDVAVLALTRQRITQEMGEASWAFARTIGHGSLSTLQQDLIDRGMNFSTARRDGQTDLASCMECWTDHIMCTTITCGSDCMDGTCRECAEENCDPAFIKCAGASRQSIGLSSDFDSPIPEEQQCKVGKYYGVPDIELPTALVQPPSAEDREGDRFQCDRQCRWVYDFFNRTIVGENANGRLIKDNQRCRCYLLHSASAAQLLDYGRELPKWPMVEFDSENTWSGDFSCQLVCADTADGLKTMTKDHAQTSPEVREIMHCGACSACSAPDDIAVLSLTRKWITKEMTGVSAEYAKPTGHERLAILRQGLVDGGMNFSTARRDGRDDLPTCMDCWTDNIMCTSGTCANVCWTKFFNPGAPPGNVDIDDCGALDLACQCLKCDEAYCGPAFIKCAGANRRSTGIVSDIPRPEEQQCKAGLYYGVPDSELPTAPDPNP